MYFGVLFSLIEFCSVNILVWVSYSTTRLIQLFKFLIFFAMLQSWLREPKYAVGALFFDYVSTYMGASI